MSASPPPAAAPSAAADSASKTAAPSTAESKSGAESKTAGEMSAEELDLSGQSLDWWMKQDKKDAAELLLKKGMVLMGVSKELGADSERGKALKKEADELLSFAGDVQNMPETKQAMEEAHKLLGELNTKYGGMAAQGQGLADESLKLWSSVSTSKEADDLVAQGKNLLADWMKYGQSAGGQELLAKAQGSVQGQSGGIVSMIDEKVLDKDGKPVVQKEKLMAVASQVTEVGKELHKELADDEDVAELMRRAQKDLTNVASKTQAAAHESILEDKESPLALQNLTEEQKNTLAIMKGESDTTAHTSAASHTFALPSLSTHLHPAPLLSRLQEVHPRPEDERHRAEAAVAGYRLLGKRQPQPLCSDGSGPVADERRQEPAGLHQQGEGLRTRLPHGLPAHRQGAANRGREGGRGVPSGQHRPVGLQGGVEGRGGGHQRGGTV